MLSYVFGKIAEFGRSRVIGIYSTRNEFFFWRFLKCCLRDRKKRRVILRERRSLSTKRKLNPSVVCILWCQIAEFSSCAGLNPKTRFSQLLCALAHLTGQSSSFNFLLTSKCKKSYFRSTHKCFFRRKQNRTLKTDKNMGSSCCYKF